MAKARQQDLIEERSIKPLEDAAFRYADLRDRRMALNREEADLKKDVRKLMKKYNKTSYANTATGVEIELVPPDVEDDVKVRVKKPKDDDADGDEGDE